MHRFQFAILLAGMASSSVVGAHAPCDYVSRAALAARAAPAPRPVADVFLAPLAGTLAVTRGFDPPATRYGPGHRGVDLAALPGASVFSAGPGVVTFAGRAAGVLAVTVTHPDGIRTTYEPLSTVAVRAGSVVIADSQLGSLAAGHPGCSAPPGQVCLHWGALLDSTGTYLDPLLLLARGEVTLLPPLPWPDG